MIFKNYIVLALSVFIVSCASTKVTENWVDADHSKPYKHPMIIGVSDSQQTRQIYEKHFVEELEKINVTATASYTLISSKQKMTRETVLEVMKGTDIDAVIITYLVSSDTEVKHHESPLSRGYSGDIEGSRLSATLVSTRGRTSSTEIITLKNDLYDRQTKTLIWSTQTRTVAPESIDEAITDVVDLLIDQMLSDNVIK
jgi:hypothetical protein